MLGPTLPLDKIESRTDNLYEAVLVIAKRARQINSDQNTKLKMQLGDFETVEELSEEDPDRESIIIEYDKIPKPTVQAINEILEDKLKWEYKEDEE